MRKFGVMFMQWVGIPTLLLLGLEGAVRLFAPADLVLQGYERHMLIDRGPDAPPLNAPNAKGIMRGQWATTNPLGFRGPDIPETADQRVLLLGDSILYGAGLKDEETAAYLLAEFWGEHVAILNSAVIGYATEDQHDFLLEFGAQLQPTAVLIGYCLNDPLTAEQPSLSTEIETSWWTKQMLGINQFFQRRSLFFIWLKGVLHIERKRYGYDAHVRPLFEPAPWSHNRETLLQMAQWCAERNIPFGLVLFPHRDQLMAQITTDQRPQHLLTTFAKTHNIPCLDVQSVLTAADFLFGDPIHLDAKGMRTVMHALANWFSPFDSTFKSI